MKRAYLLVVALILLSACQADFFGVAPTDITLNTKDITVEKGKESTLTVTFMPSNSKKVDLTWISLDPSVATVQDGIVYGVESGCTEIVVKYGELTDKCTVTVIIPATAINLNTPKLTLTQGDSKKLIATLEPSSSTDEVRWETSNERIATVNQGVVTGIAEGEATITAIAGTLKTACNVKICALEAIDLGLSVKWANMNIGAASPEDFGDYYAWGELEPYYYSLEPLIWKEDKPDGYIWASNKWFNGNAWEILKYCTNNNSWAGTGAPDNKTVLDAEDDVASVISGGKWRLPTLQEQDELRSKCTWAWTTKKGILGYEVTSKRNGNSIFIPASGGIAIKYYGETGLHGCYWSSTIEETLPRQACVLVIKADVVGWGPGDRCNGYTVRPVTKE